MKELTMTLVELQDIFGKRVNVSMRTDLTPEEMAIENATTRQIVDVGKQMINMADIVMRHEALLAKCKGLEKSLMPEIIGGYDEV